MNFEDLQKNWQAQDAGLKLTINVDILLREVRRNQREFEAAIFRRDTVEVMVCGIMTAFFGVWGALWHWWSFGLLAAGCLFVGAFFVIDRLRERRRQPVRNDTLRASIECSLHQVNHQIWLLKNIFWWYLLPILIGLSCVAGSVVWATRLQGRTAMISTAAVYLVTYGSVYGWVYWLNQRAVRQQLEPRRQELEALRDSLGPSDAPNGSPTLDQG